MKIKPGSYSVAKGIVLEPHLNDPFFTPRDNSSEELQKRHINKHKSITLPFTTLKSALLHTSVAPQSDAVPGKFDDDF